MAAETELTTECTRTWCHGRVTWHGRCDRCGERVTPIDHLPGHDAPAPNVAMAEIDRLTRLVEEYREVIEAAGAYPRGGRCCVCDTLGQWAVRLLGSNIDDWETYCCRECWNRVPKEE